MNYYVVFKSNIICYIYGFFIMSFDGPSRSNSVDGKPFPRESTLDDKRKAKAFGRNIGKNTSSTRRRSFSYDDYFHRGYNKGVADNGAIKKVMAIIKCQSDDLSSIVKKTNINKLIENLETQKYRITMALGKLKVWSENDIERVISDDTERQVDECAVSAFERQKAQKRKLKREGGSEQSAVTSAAKKAKNIPGSQEVITSKTEGLKPSGKKVESRRIAHSEAIFKVYEFSDSDGSSTSDSDESLSSSNTERSSEKGRNNLPSICSTKSKYLMSNTQGSYVDKEFKVTPFIDSLFGIILDEIAELQEGKGFAQTDIISYLKIVTDCSQGEIIKELLEAVVLLGESGLLKVHAFQKKYAATEKLLDLNGFRRFQHYLVTQVYNDRKVGFTLDDLDQFVRLKNGNDKSITCLPPKLKGFVEHSVVNRVIDYRSTTDVAIVKRNFMKMVGETKLGKSSVDFLAALVKKEIKIKDFQGVQKGLENFTKEELSINDHEWSSKADDFITIKQAQELQKYFFDHFFQKWLLAFDAEAFRKEMERNVQE
nr:hypothetical protein [Endozoicomonas sp.]